MSRFCLDLLHVCSVLHAIIFAKTFLDFSKWNFLVMNSLTTVNLQFNISILMSYHSMFTVHLAHIVSRNNRMKQYTTQHLHSLEKSS